MDSCFTCLIVVPTFNECDNLRALVPRLRDAVPGAHILIVDDASPDGTGAVAEEFAREDSAVHVLHRATKDGLGRAYVAGLGWGVARGYDRLIQIDADLSHDPESIPALLAASANFEVVLGSRYVAGGSTRNWGIFRRALSQAGSRCARTLLGLPYRDMTGGFKCWRLSVLEDICLPAIRSNGYTFQIETTYRAALRGHTITEIPITFTDRVAGHSKMNGRILWEAVGMVWWLRARARAIRTEGSGGPERAGQKATAPTPARGATFV